MIIKTQEHLRYVDADTPTSIVQIRLFGVSIYRKERAANAITTWLFGIPVYRVQGECLL